MIRKTDRILSVRNPNKKPKSFLISLRGENNNFNTYTLNVARLVFYKFEALIKTPL